MIQYRCMACDGLKSEGNAVLRKYSKRGPDCVVCRPCGKKIGTGDCPGT